MSELNVGKLADDLQSLVSDAEELLRATAGVAGEKASEARDRAEESLRAVRSRLKSVERDLTGRARVVGEYGKLLVQQGRSSDAVQFLSRAVQLAPSDWTY